MNIVHAEYNKYHNIIDINYYNGYILRIDCGKAEDGLITTPNSQRMLDALAIDNPEYYGAAEPPVRCGESHLSGLTEPLRSL